MEKKYWKSIEELQPEFQTEKQEKEISTREILENESGDKNAASRRDFLKWCGISFFSATVVSACENPVKKAIPYVQQPEEVTSGQAYYYATTYNTGNQYCSVLVKNRDGRPIKIEGNKLSPFSMGGTNAHVQASVLSLYDDGARYKAPMKDKQPTTWQAMDSEMKVKLNELVASGKKIAIVTPTLLSPSTRTLINEFAQQYNTTEHVQWDAISYDAIRKAYDATIGMPVIPDHNFDQADLIISFSADFLGTWLSPATFANRYSKTRKLDEGQKKMSHHVQFEAGMSVTGANADSRIAVKPSEEINIIMALYNELAAMTGNPVVSSPSVDYDTKALAQKIADRNGKTLVVSGHNNPAIQTVIAAINNMAGSFGNTLDIDRNLGFGMGSNESMEQLVAELVNNEVGAVMFYNCNPLYSYPDQEKLKSALEKTDFTVSFAVQKDETAEACNYILPDNHYLESWNDAAPRAGEFSLAQPAIRPLFKTRQFQSTLLALLDRDPGFHNYIKSNWENTIYTQAGTTTTFDTFWTSALQKGAVLLPSPQTSVYNYSSEAIQRAFLDMKVATEKAGDIEFVLYEDVSMGEGAVAHNPWLQELPDPVTKVTWDNYAAISPRFAEEKDIAEGEIININGVELPVLIQPGQAFGTISMALGYGRATAGKGGEGIGTNVYPLMRAGMQTGTVESWEITGDGYEFGRTQTQFDMHGRPIVRESTLDKYLENPKAGNKIRDYHKKYASTLYPGHEYPGHHWVLMIDLNACTGCSTCVVSCQAENNVPVIGKTEVIRRRIMHWMRIDRYYNGDLENPGVVFQPVMCQHCDNAPCENVCPVTATNHSHQGINQIAYNRCIGTKYCMNNCPYKVRRFNWFRYAQNEKFDYNMNSDLGRMVLNPDVTVRERGVVEKCSFCIQRIQEGKLKAKREQRPLKDGEITPACADSCPSNALVFGDVNDPNSRVAKLIQDPRNYHLLEELHTLPTVGYLTKIRNTDKKESKA